MRGLTPHYKNKIKGEIDMAKPIGKKNNKKEFLVTEMDFSGNYLETTQIIEASTFTELIDIIYTKYAIQKGVKKCNIDLNYYREKDYRNREKTDKELIIHRMFVDADEFATYNIIDKKTGLPKRKTNGEIATRTGRWFIGIDFENDEGTIPYPHYWMVELEDKLTEGGFKMQSRFG
jgi:hypothetical protein